MKYGMEEAGTPESIQLKACERPRFRKRVTCVVHNERWSKVINCGECRGCLNRWRGRVKHRIAAGARLRPSRRALFLTFTLCNYRRPFSGLGKCRNCGRWPDQHPHRKSAEQLLLAWRKLRRGRWWQKHVTGGDFVRVIESHKDGAVHLHVLVYSETLPVVKAARTREPLRRYKEKQRPSGRYFIQKTAEAGFGQIMDSQVVRKGTNAIIAYMGKYLSKTEKKSYDRRGVAFTRVFDCAKGWTPANEHNHTFADGVATVHRGQEGDHSEEKPTCPCVSQIPEERRQLAKQRTGITNRSFTKAQEAGFRLAKYKMIRKIRAWNYRRKSELLLEIAEKYPYSLDMPDEYRKKFERITERLMECTAAMFLTCVWSRFYAVTQKAIDCLIREGEHPCLLTGLQSESA